VPTNELVYGRHPHPYPHPLPGVVKKYKKPPQDRGKTNVRLWFWSIGRSHTPESQVSGPDTRPTDILFALPFFYGPLQDIMGFVVQLSTGSVSSGHIISGFKAPTLLSYEEAC